MDARELTKVCNELQNSFIEMKKTVEYLEQEVNKLRLLTEDMKVDIAMMDR